MSAFSGGYGPEEEDGAGWEALAPSKAELQAEARQAALERAAALVVRLRFALGDGDGKLTDSQLARRAYELSQKARNWDDWHEAQNRIEAEMPEGWAFVVQCSPGDWDVYLTDPDGERPHLIEAAKRWRHR